MVLHLLFIRSNIKIIKIEKIIKIIEKLAKYFNDT